MTSEFDFIHSLKSLLSSHHGLYPDAQNFEDDVCILGKIGTDYLIASKDMLTEGTHFFENDPVDKIVQKAIRTNISDIAAKGAKPYGMMLALCLPPSYQTSNNLKLIHQAIADECAFYNIPLCGGDTISGERLTLSVTLFGLCSHIPPKRSDAKIGDIIYVTGILGLSSSGLALRLGKETSRHAELFLEHYLLPNPPLWAGQALGQYMNASCDISDGLLQDLGHILTASGVGAEIDSDTIPHANAFDDFETNLHYAMTGGDDYHILFTSSAPPHIFQKIAAEYQIKITPIGVITKDGHIHYKNNKHYDFSDKGYKNF